METDRHGMPDHANQRSVTLLEIDAVQSYSTVGQVAAAPSAPPPAPRSILPLWTTRYGLFSSLPAVLHAPHDRHAFAHLRFPQMPPQVRAAAPVPSQTTHPPCPVTSLVPHAEQPHHSTMKRRSSSEGRVSILLHPPQAPPGDKELSGHTRTDTGVR